MYKISSQIIDYYDDESLLLDILGGNIPDHVKKACVLSHEQLEDVVDDEFAVIIMTKTGSKSRKYPVMDKEHTALSCEAFKRTAHRLPPEAVKTAASNLYSSCVYYSMECPESIVKMATDISSNLVEIDEESDLPMEYYIKEKIASLDMANVKDDEYGLIIKTASETKKLYPLNTRANVEAAMVYFNKHASCMVSDHRREFAKNIIKMACRLGVEIHDGISNHSGDIVGNNAKCNILRRMDFAKEAKHVDFIKGLADRCEEFGSEKTIELLSEFDKLAGITQRYGCEIKDPPASVFEKIAIDEKVDNKLLRPEMIKNYAMTDASFELRGHIPDLTIDEFIKDPLETYGKMSEIQKLVIFNGVTGVL